MNSLFTGEPSERTVEGQSKEDLVRSRFVDSVDILQKMKAIQLKKNQMGQVAHTYSVVKEQRHKAVTKRQSEDIQPKRKGSPKKVSELTLQKDEASAPVNVEQAKLSQQIVKERKFRLRNELSVSRESPRLSRSNTNLLLTRTEEMRPITDRPMDSLKTSELRKTFHISKSSIRLKPLALGKVSNEERQSVDVESDMNIVDVVERDLQRRDIYKRQIIVLAQTNKELRNKIAGKLKPTVRRSFLERIELRNQIPVCLPPKSYSSMKEPRGPCGITY
jgi:hypothetical protein